MAGLEAESVDSIVCDPPYGLFFMGKGWDHGVPGVEFWTEALRVAKPGAHLLAFGGTRTYHRLAVAIEDAGWEIRDCLMWVYGSGFPKSLDVSKAIDKAAGAERGEETPHPTNQCKGGQWCKCQTLDATGRYSPTKHPAVTAPATEAARQWSGWGTALKPAWEPIIMARKPLIGTVAQNVLRHGTGGINVDACRVGFHGEADKAAAAAQRSCQDQNKNRTAYGKFNNGEASLEPYLSGMDKGRWPANVIHDGSDEVVAMFPQANHKTGGPSCKSIGGNGIFNGGGAITPQGYGDSGSAARFFYVPKASKADRDEGLPEGKRSTHPTVKPTTLMRYLCRLITQPGGIVLDPFTGSGSTGKAAILEGFRFIGTELEAEYFEIAKARISHAIANYQPLEDKPAQLTLLPEQP